MMFMTQYTELWGALDLIAERIRALGSSASASYQEFGKLTSIEETVGVPEGDGDGAHPGEGPRGLGAHGAQSLPGGGQGGR